MHCCWTPSPLSGLCDYLVPPMGKLRYGPLKWINKYRAFPPTSKIQHPHSKDADQYWQPRHFCFNQFNANKFWKNCILKMHSSIGHKQPNVNRLSPVKGKHLHTLILKVDPHQHLPYSRCLCKDWKVLLLVTSFTVTASLWKAEEHWSSAALSPAA